MRRIIAMHATIFAALYMMSRNKNPNRVYPNTRTRLCPHIGI